MPVGAMTVPAGVAAAAKGAKDTPTAIRVPAIIVNDLCIIHFLS